MYRQVSDKTIESQLVNLVKENGGSLSTSLIKERYKLRYKKHLPVSGKLTVWLESFNRIRVHHDPNPKNNDCIVRLAETTRLLLSKFHTELRRPNHPNVPTSEPAVFEPEDEPPLDLNDLNVANVEEHLARTLGDPKPMKVHHDMDSIIDMLREEWFDAVEKLGVENITEFALDVDRRPICWANGKRHFLTEDESLNVTEDDINWILRDVGDFTDQNRAGISGTLHRVSANFDNSNKLNGLTIRLGRNVEGVTDIIKDLLVDTDKSILILGVVSCSTTLDKLLKCSLFCFR